MQPVGPLFYDLRARKKKTPRDAGPVGEARYCPPWDSWNLARYRRVTARPAGEGAQIA